MPKDIGKSKKNQVSGGETWTVGWHKPGPNHYTGFHEGQRFRLEDEGNPHKMTMYPEEDTELYLAGNEEIEMTTDNGGDTFTYQATFDGSVIYYWWYEGDSPKNPPGWPDDEAQIWRYDPLGGGMMPGGSAGSRR